MWADAFDEALAVLWENLSNESSPLSVENIYKKTGVSASVIYTCLSKMKEVGLLDIADSVNNSWRLKKNLDPLEWARAVEIGIPLTVLERTSNLSISGRKKAEKAINSGVVDKERAKLQKSKIKKRNTILRGRAATRAATTDLAQIVQDAQIALPSSDNKIREIFRLEAAKALESLIKALEK